MSESVEEEFEKWWQSFGYKTHQFSLESYESLKDDCHTMYLAGRADERKRCALEAQSFQKARCLTSYDDAVDQTAERIKEAIMDIERQEGI